MQFIDRNKVADILAECSCDYRKSIEDQIEKMKLYSVDDVIIDTVCSVHGIPKDRLTCKCKDQELVTARQQGCLLLRILTNQHPTVIAVRVGMKRANVYHSIKTAITDLARTMESGLFDRCVDELKKTGIDFPEDWRDVVEGKSRVGKRIAMSMGAGI